MLTKIFLLMILISSLAINMQIWEIKQAIEKSNYDIMDINYSIKIIPAKIDLLCDLANNPTEIKIFNDNSSTEEIKGKLEKHIKHFNWLFRGYSCRQ